jgi:hypothetical protein
MGGRARTRVNTCCGGRRAGEGDALRCGDGGVGSASSGSVGAVRSGEAVERFRPTHGAGKGLGQSPGSSHEEGFFLARHEQVLVAGVGRTGLPCPRRVGTPARCQRDDASARDRTSSLIPSRRGSVLSQATLPNTVHPSRWLSQTEAIRPIETIDTHRTWSATTRRRFHPSKCERTMVLSEGMDEGGRLQA